MRGASKSLALAPEPQSAAVDGPRVDTLDFARRFSRWLQAEPAVQPFRERHAGSLEGELERARPYQRLLWDAGWTRWGWPPACGGLGGDARLRAVVYEELYAAGFPLPEGLTSSEVMGPALIHYAPALAAQYLASYLRGDELWCQGFSEPDAGSDLAALRTRARRDGAGFRVTGQKTWSSFGATADRCFILVRTGGADSGHRGLTMMFVDLASPGVTVVPTRAATGRNEFAEIFFDDVEVGPDRLVGDIGEGWQVAMYLLQWERGMYAWERQSYLHHVLQRSVQNLPPESASQHGRQVGAAYLAVYALRCTARRTVRLLAEGANPGPAISVAKVLLSSTEQLAFDTILDIGAPVIEFGDGSDAELLRVDYLYTRAATIYGGSAEIQRNIIAERILGLPRE